MTLCEQLIEDFEKKYSTFKAILPKVDGDYDFYSDEFVAFVIARCEKQDKNIERFRNRDCNATVQLTYNDGENPFATEDLKIIDVGVADNIYVVESKVFETLQLELATLKQAIDDAQKTWYDPDNFVFLKYDKTDADEGVHNGE